MLQSPTFSWCRSALYTLCCAVVLSGCGGAEEASAEEPSAEDPVGQIAQAQAGGGAASPGAKAGGSAATTKTPAPPAALDPLRNRPDLPVEQIALTVINGEERRVERGALKAAGFTLVDLSNHWTPFIFQQMFDPEGRPLLNRYQRIYRGLANDKTDGDGRALPKGEKNYLEVFGIPPSLSVLRSRFLEDEAKTCFAGIDFDLVASLDRLIYRSKRRQRRFDRKAKKAWKTVRKAFKKAGIEDEDLDKLLALRGDLSDSIELARTQRDQVKLLADVERRLACDGHDNRRFKHKKGKRDQGLRLAIRRFQRKHMIYEHTNVRGKTIKMLGTVPIKTNHMALRRAITERVVAATSIVEDGSAQIGKKPVEYVGKDGKTHALRNLVEEFTDAAMKQLGLQTPEAALAFFKRHDDAELATLMGAVRFPAYPEYYAEHMDLKIFVDRGDVWYDPPYDAEGKKLKQPRGRLPKFNIMLDYEGQEIRLARFKTTIGGWRTEQAENGYEYLKYKKSNIGNRVIRKIIAGPTWIPPKTTPLRSLAKRRYVNGKAQGVVNYSEMGPGYLSAYGLVAGYFVKPGRKGRHDVDQGIRAHGSSDYMSILSAQRFSHGCHRLMNHLAVRTYGFVLNHRNMVVDGDQTVNHHRQFLYKDQVYEVRLPSRGFQYRLDPPLPVRVGKGRVRGELNKPVEGLFKVPGQAYPERMPGDEEEEEDAKKTEGAAN